MSRQVHFHSSTAPTTHHPTLHPYLYPIITLRSPLAARRLRHKLYEPWPTLFPNHRHRPASSRRGGDDDDGEDDFLKFKKRAFAVLIADVVRGMMEPVVEKRVLWEVRNAIGIFPPLIR